MGFNINAAHKCIQTLQQMNSFQCPIDAMFINYGCSCSTALPLTSSSRDVINERYCLIPTNSRLLCSHLSRVEADSDVRTDGSRQLQLLHLERRNSSVSSGWRWCQTAGGCMPSNCQSWRQFDITTQRLARIFIVFHVFIWILCDTKTLSSVQMCKEYILFKKN